MQRPTPRHAARPVHGRARGRRGGLSRPRVAVAALLVVAVAACAVMAAVPTSPLRRLLLGTRYPEVVVEAAGRHGVDPALACAVIRCESGWDEGAVSHAGAVGLMQVMPATAQHLADLGLVDATAYDPAELADPVVNIEYGCACLEYLERSLSTTEEVVAAYNAGLGAVQGWLAGGGSIPDDIEYPETRAYVDRVMSAYEGYRESYPDGIA